VDQATSAVDAAREAAEQAMAAQGRTAAAREVADKAAAALTAAGAAKAAADTAAGAVAAVAQAGEGEKAAAEIAASTAAQEAVAKATIAMAAARHAADTAGAYASAKDASGPSTGTLDLSKTADPWKSETADPWKESVVDISRGGEVQLSSEATDPHSPTWAKVVKPVTGFLLCLLAIVMLLPFFITTWLLPSSVKIDFPPGTTAEQSAMAMSAAVEALAAKRANLIFDWAKTILPSVVGFASAMVGYYFGTRASDLGRRDTQGPRGGTDQ
jgi:hypothetical protein